MIEPFERLLGLLEQWEMEGELGLREVCLIQIAKSLAEIAKEVKK